MNITSNYLFTLITNNDYIKLEQIIDTNKDRDVFLKRKSFETLLSKAVLCRSQQCFDLLCNMTIENNEDKDMFYTRALHNAIDYYVAAPNSHNMYYIDIIMDRNITIDYYAMYKSLKNNELFIRFFHLFDKKPDNIKKLIIMAIINNTEMNFEFLYNYGVANNMITTDIKNEIYTQALHSTNINMITFLINNGITWTLSHEIPSLYIVLNNNIFYYLYNKYSELTKDELNSIHNIKEKFPHDFSINKQSLFNFKKMLSLPFDFDMSDIIANIFKYIYNYKIYNSSYDIQLMTRDISIRYIVMEQIFDSNKVKTNPLLKINYADFSSKHKNNITILTNHQILLQQYKYNIMQFVDMCKRYNYTLDTFII
jgi:hypothetical protein